MPYEVYKIAHVIGVVLVFAALGGQAFWVRQGGTKEATEGRGMLMATHGVGLLVLLVAGFGMHAKAGFGWDQGWVWAKIALWLAIGGLIAVPWRRPDLAVPIWWSLPALGGLAAWLAIAKPF